MSWAGDWITATFTPQQRETIEQRLERYRREAQEINLERLDRREELEDGVAHALLLLNALTESCIRRGVFTRDELAAAIDEIDLLDGVADGKLDPSAYAENAAAVKGAIDDYKNGDRGRGAHELSQELRQRLGGASDE